MGAYEFQDGKAAEIVLGDVDGDGSVGAVDLAALRASIREHDSRHFAKWLIFP
jgi:hypothetical protein